MTRVARMQSDLFPPRLAEPEPVVEPLVELRRLLGTLRVADALPWPDLATTVAEERRALSLARSSGAEGEALASAIMEQTERLLSATE